MFTTATLMGSLRPILHWVRARMASDTSMLRVLQRVLAIEPCRVPAPVPIPVPRRPRVASAVMAAALATVAVLPNASLAQAWHGNGNGYGNRQSDFEFAADGRLIDVQIQVDGVGTVPLYTANGRFDRRYFQAFKGRNYSLVVRNNTNRRVGVLMAVDGLNVINGQKSPLSRNESMYVLDPFESTVIRGWRASMDHVRRFVFVDEERSYADRTGQANGDMGWIRVLAFREQLPYWDVPGKIRTWERGDEPAPYGGRLEGEGGAPGPAGSGSCADTEPVVRGRAVEPGHGLGQRAARRSDSHSLPRRSDAGGSRRPAVRVRERTARPRHPHLERTRSHLGA